DLGVERGELAGDGGADDEVVHRLLDEGEVLLEPRELAVHLLDLDGARERVLAVALPRQREPPLGVLELVADLLELALGDDPALEELAAALVLPTQPRPVVLELGELLAEVELVLVEREAGGADAVDLLLELGLVAERLERELVVGEAQERLPGL